MHRAATSITQMDTYYTQERVFRKLFRLAIVSVSTLAVAT